MEEHVEADQKLIKILFDAKRETEQMFKGRIEQFISDFEQVMDTVGGETKDDRESIRLKETDWEEFKNNLRGGTNKVIGVCPLCKKEGVELDLDFGGCLECKGD